MGCNVCCWSPRSLRSQRARGSDNGWQRSGLIVNISFWAAQKHVGNVAYGVSKAATDKMTSDTSQELRESNVAVVSLYPGLVRTEKVMEAAAYLDSVTLNLLSLLAVQSRPWLAIQR